jgi:hypothetical protein
MVPLPDRPSRHHALAREGRQRARGCCGSGDFTRWKEHDAYQKALDRLLRELRVEKA